MRASSSPSKLIASVAVVASFCLVAVGCTGSDDDARPTTTTVTTAAEGTVEGWTPPPVTWSPCEASPRHDCATFEVPLDWAATDGETIELAVTRSPATGDRIGSLFVNPGGPGGSGVQFLQGSDFSPDLNERFDIVSWDPRGVGASTGFTCGADGSVEAFLANDPGPDDDAEADALYGDAEALAVACSSPEGADGALAANIGTDSVARDLEALRIALGDDALNYLGLSYGSMIGQRYLALFPESARAIVLDGVVDPSQDLVTWLTEQATAFERILDRVIADCDDDCPVDDLGESFDQLAEQVEREPLANRDAGAALGPAELQIAAIYTTYSPGLWPRFAKAVAAALDGDPAQMLSLARGYYDFGGYVPYAAVTCIDNERPADLDAYVEFTDALIETAPRVGAAVASELAPCAFWEVPSSGIGGFVSAPDAAPVLVIGTTGDAATPYENAVSVADALESGVLVTVEGEGHTAYGRSTCVTEVVDRYFIDLDVPTSDPRCAG